MNVEIGAADQAFASRLRSMVRDYRSTSALAKVIGRSEGALRNWLTGRSQPVVGDVLRLCAATGTRVEWLMTGRGGRHESDPIHVSEPSVPYGAPLNESLLRSIAEAVEHELSAQSIEITPQKKAGLISCCYSFMEKVRDFDSQAVAHLVKLAG